MLCNLLELRQIGIMLRPWTASILITIPMLFGGVIFADSLSPAQAMAPEEVARLAKPVTVEIKTSDSNGSGVIIAKSGNRYTVLTAAHVVRNRQQKYNLSTGNGNQYPLVSSTIRTFPQSVDLALVEFTSSQNYKVAKIGNSDNAVEGSMAFVSGFPQTTIAITASVYQFRSGQIVANSTKPLAGGYGIIYNAHTLPGMSGGGVFNDRGELIAIHGKGDVDSSFKADEINANVRFKTGNDLGVPINTYVRMAGSLPAAPSIATQPTTVPRSRVASDFYITGVAQAQRQNHQGAIESYSQAIQSKPNYSAAYLNRGVARAELGDREGSLTDQNRSLSIDPLQPDIYVNRGILRYQAGDREGALVEYSKAISLSSDDPLVYYNRAIIYGELGRWAESVADYDLVIKYAPRYVNAHYNRGISNTKLGKWAAAISDFDRAILLRPNHPQALNNRGNLKLKIGDRAGALADYTQAIALKPDYALAYTNRVSVRLQLRQKEAALADLREAARIYRAQGNTAKYEETMETYRLIGGR
jgi:tetratricopeptide (TPR) repeat protein